jgi:hypothetical protein
MAASIVRHFIVFFVSCLRAAGVGEKPPCASSFAGNMRRSPNCCAIDGVGNEKFRGSHRKKTLDIMY